MDSWSPLFTLPCILTRTYTNAHSAWGACLSLARHASSVHPHEGASAGASRRLLSSTQRSFICLPCVTALPAGHSLVVRSLARCCIFVTLLSPNVFACKHVLAARIHVPAIRLHPLCLLVSLGAPACNINIKHPSHSVRPSFDALWVACNQSAAPACMLAGRRDTAAHRSSKRPFGRRQALAVRGGGQGQGGERE